MQQRCGSPLPDPPPLAAIGFTHLEKPNVINGLKKRPPGLTRMQETLENKHFLRFRVVGF